MPRSGTNCGGHQGTQRGQLSNCGGHSSQPNNQGGHGAQPQGYGGCNKPTTHVSSTKFIGNCTELKGHIFDCSNYKQADKYVNTIKHISEYVGLEYKHDGNIHASIVNEEVFVIPHPAAPDVVDPINPTPDEQFNLRVLDKEINAYIKCQGILANNLQKAYSLVLGQCTNLLQSKLKQQATWAAISGAQDAIGLLSLIKSIAFRFKDQKFLPLVLYHSKLYLYSFHQLNLTNDEYLK